MVVAGAVPLVIALVGTGTATATAQPAQPAAMTGHSPAAAHLAAIAADIAEPGAATAPEALAAAPGAAQQSAAAPGAHTTLAWSRPVPDKAYLAPLGGLHAPTQVAPVAPIAPPPGQLRFGDVTIESPAWLDSQQAAQVNDGAANAEAGLATFLDSVGMERSRSDRVASQTIGSAAVGAVAGASASTPLAATSAVVGAVAGLIAGVPFLPAGLVAGPILGAAIGAAVITVPAAAIGAAAGAAIGAADALAAPPHGQPTVVQPASGGVVNS
ncbi:hypothetical protein GV794_06770 [Nocardia cyriacigeorgica]|uniref:DUF456 domain-containing protein n=1 Tax=Nocardia cyriacigeorgica TaxID=135487 RepID=A0A6P1D6X2_9NOCA|nr:hypothetical protein [Nocardia cyriacigeorgica]NEW51406.1 hypothetical protein [Nocardia cyriacigeorgica]NEW55358.1 hypothetical protein [Nocardia cyriacigeorgica]